MEEEDTTKENVGAKMCIEVVFEVIVEEHLETIEVLLEIEDAEVKITEEVISEVISEVTTIIEEIGIKMKETGIKMHKGTLYKMKRTNTHDVADIKENDEMSSSKKRKRKAKES